MSRPYRQTAVLSFLVLFLLLNPLSFAQESNRDDPLVKGKAALDRGDDRMATILLTAALDLHPVIGDYALFWRAIAYEARGEYADTMADLSRIRSRYPGSPLLQKVRKKEAEVFLIVKPPLLHETLKEYVRDYPSDFDITLKYAHLLREGGSPSEAKKLFKEVYLSHSSLSEKALAALAPEDITQADLYRRGQNLNNAWMFRESEGALREALARDGRELRGKIRDSLAYSLFRQKRYPEAADLYGEAGNAYWRARSLLRAGQMKTFEEELQKLTRSKDSRTASVLINYASRKRREGSVSDAVKILNDVMSRYPSSKEEALWTLGWTYYRAGKYAKSAEIFTQLSSQYKDAKYDYWAAKARKELDASSDLSAVKKRSARRDFYFYISMLARGEKGSWLSSPPSQRGVQTRLTERIDLLRRLDLRAEAASEMLHLSRKSGNSSDLISLSSALNELGEFHASLSLAVKAPYSENLHDLYYPRGFREEIDNAARRCSLDPALIAAVIREESRFDRRARSIAGALGLMQLMPETARRTNQFVNAPMKTPEDLFHPQTNILLGACYLRHLTQTFNARAPAIAAYNAGEDVVRGWLKTGDYHGVDEFIEDIPYDETRNYVKKVLVSFFEYLRTRPDVDISRVRSLIGDL